MAVTSLLPGEDATRARLLRLRFEARARVAERQRRLDQIDPALNPRAHGAMEQLVEQAADQLDAIERELAGGEAMSATGLSSNPVDGEITTAEARTALRQRLVHLAMMIDRHSTPSCAAAAQRLRQAIRRELRTLETERGRTTP